jgi:hypothetical protein
MGRRRGSRGVWRVSSYLNRIGGSGVSERYLVAFLGFG